MPIITKLIFYDSQLIIKTLIIIIVNGHYFLLADGIYIIFASIKYFAIYIFTLLLQIKLLILHDRLIHICISSVEWTLLVRN